MIIEYEDQYSEDLKLLLEELQEYIASIDKEHYNIITENSKEQCFLETMKEANMLLDNCKTTCLIHILITTL